MNDTSKESLEKFVLKFDLEININIQKIKWKYFLTELSNDFLLEIDDRNRDCKINSLFCLFKKRIVGPLLSA